MELTPALIYLIAVTDSIKSLCTILSVSTLVMAAFFSIIWYCESYDPLGDIKKYKTFLKYAVAIFTLIALASVLTPSKDTMVAMYILPKIATIENVQDIPDDVSELIKALTKKLTE